MSSANERALEYYASFAKNSLDFLEDISIDLEFEESGGQIIYAIDFSEVYSYAMSGASTFFFEHKGKIFDSYFGTTAVVELHEAVLEHILFERSENYLFLPPYIAELFNFVRGLNSGLMGRAAKDTAKIMRQLQKTQNGEEYANLLELASQDDVLVPGSEESVEFKRRFTALMPELIDVWKSAKSPGPVEKIGAFMSRPFIQVGEMRNVSGDVDEPVKERWFSELNRRRPDRRPQNLSDATAIGYIYSLNKQICVGENPKKVVLISRSKNLYDIMSGDVSNWNDVGGSIVRHPRSFLNEVTSIGRSRGSQTISSRRSNIDWWRKTYSQISNYANENKFKGHLTNREWVNRSLAILVDAWKRFCSAQVSSRIIEQQGGVDDLLLRALVALNQQGNLRGVISEIIDDIHQQIDKMHFSIPERLAFSERVPAYLHQQTLDVSSEKNNLQTSRVTLRTYHGTQSSFNMRFVSPRIRNILKESAGNLPLALETLSESVAFDEADDGELYDVEWYLAMAYIFCAMGVWRSAFRSLRGAMTRLEELKAGGVSKREATVVEFEIDYLLSRTLRELGEPREEQIRQVDRLESHIKQILKIKVNEKKRSLARLRTEKIKSLFFITSIDRAAHGGIEERLRDCIRKCENDIDDIDDPETEIQFYNTIAYHLFESDGVFDQEERMARVIESFERFVELGSRLYSKYAEWPENYLDTFCWIAFKLDEGGWVDFDRWNVRRSRLIKLLEINANREYISEKDEREFSVHLSYVEAKWGGNV